jgi:hypothetical protein
MHLRKLISIWALLALLLGQIALAEHSAEHIDHGFSLEIASAHDDHGHDNHEEDSQKHHCPECVLTHSLLVDLDNLPAVITPEDISYQYIVPRTFVAQSKSRYSLNSPRAPPAILI